jgi:carboxymethylenebutenolidase
MGGMIDYPVDRGTTSGYLSVPPGGKGPGVLLLHAWWGLNDFFKELADRLAAEGFLVLATDLYEGRTASTVEDAERLINSLDYMTGISDVVAAADYLLLQPGQQGGRLGAIGFSMGGAYATWLSTLRPEVKALVLFYGGVEQDDSFAGRTLASFLGHFAERDEYESAENVRKLETQLKNAGRQADFITYPGTGHWFFESDRLDAYEPRAAAEAWRRTIDFLHSKLG